MRDVAALAGVSLKTVSRVVNLEPHTRPEVVRRVRQAIAELDWVPNGSARALRTGRTGVLAVAVPGLSRPADAALVQAVVEEAERRGLQAAVEPTGAPGQRAARLRAVVSSLGAAVDAVVVLGPHGDALAPLRPGSPVVCVHAGGTGPAGSTAPVDAVGSDLAEASGLLAHHLAVVGRSRTVLVGCERLTGEGGGLRAALRAAGAGAVAEVAPSAQRREDGYGAVDGVIAALRGDGADAVLCGSDEVALGLLAALDARGVAVPEELVVAGVDGLEEGAFSAPSLTTVSLSPELLARAALDLVADRLARTAPPQEPRRALVPVQLVRRESTTRPAPR